MKIENASEKFKKVNDKVASWIDELRSVNEDKKKKEEELSNTCEKIAQVNQKDSFLLLLLQPSSG